MKNLINWTMLLVFTLGMSTYGVAQSTTVKRTKAPDEKVVKAKTAEQVAETKANMDDEQKMKEEKSEMGKHKAKMKGKAKGHEKGEHKGKGHAKGKNKDKSGARMAKSKAGQVERQSNEGWKDGAKEAGEMPSKSRKGGNKTNMDTKTDISKKALVPAKGN